MGNQFNPERERAIKQHAVEDALERHREEFTEYLIDESDETLRVDTFDTDAVREALLILDWNGYAVDESDDDYEPTQIFASPDDYHDFLDSVDRVARLSDTTDDRDVCGGGHVNAYGATVYFEHHVPDNVALAIHPDAVCPSHASDVSRPYLVRHGNGVVFIGTDE
jgi:hypothetical protein